MNLRRLGNRATREWVGWLLLPALALRLLVPAGFMPMAGDGLVVTMQMCHGDALSSVVIRLTGTDETPPARHAQHDAPCVFAASAAIAPPAFPVAVSAPAVAPNSIALPREQVPAARILRLPQSPRAPPTPV